jgi:TetR/AcrR family transcriptional regulator of autoinduction and epiphytic fitness
MQTPEMASEAVRIRPRETRGDRTRARLVEAALDEFREHGIERASIARIAQAAGVSRPTFYFHFPKKEDLLRELLTGFEGEVADRVGRPATLRDALDELISSILDVQAQVGPLVFSEMLRAQTRELPPDEERSTAVVDALAPLFRKAAESGELRIDHDPERAASIYLASMFGCLLDHDRAGQPDDLRALTSLFFRSSSQGGPS